LFLRTSPPTSGRQEKGKAGGWQEGQAASEVIVAKKRKGGHSKAHPGFKAVQKKIAKKYGMKRAGAILAASTRKAKRGPAGKRNPRLKRVKG